MIRRPVTGERPEEARARLAAVAAIVRLGWAGVNEPYEWALQRAGFPEEEFGRLRAVAEKRLKAKQDAQRVVGQFER